MQRFSICLVQPPQYKHSLALQEVCQLLAESLESLAVPCQRQINTIEPGTVNIVVGYHLLGSSARERLAAHPVILYQLEQLPDREGWFTPDRAALLDAALAVWDYSSENLDFLRARGIRRAMHVPLGYHRQLERIRHREDASKDIDVLFYGSVNERRAAVMREIQKRLRAEWLFGVYGEERDQYIARSRIVLNLHFYQARILEQVRLTYLLNNRCFVVSEDAEQNPYGDGIITGPIETLPALCERFAGLPEERQATAERGYETLRRHPMTDHVRTALHEMNLL